jgi:hypothetical protein
MQAFLAQLGVTLIALAGIAGATVAVSLGKIDGQTYAAIVSGVLGIGLGAGVHAAGTQAVKPPNGTTGSGV